MRRGVGWTGVLLALGLGGCDFGPSGPGLLSATVSGPEPLGAAVLEVVGSGIQGFEGAGGTLVVSSVASVSEGRHRVLVVDPSGGDLHFSIRVDDVSAESIGASVVYATSPANAALTASVVGVRVER